MARRRGASPWRVAVARRRGRRQPGTAGQGRAVGLVLTVWSVNRLGKLHIPRLRWTGPSWSRRCGRSGRAGCCHGRRTWSRPCSAGSSGTSSAAAGCAWRAATSCRNRATSGPRPPGRAACCWSAARMARCGRSRIPAGTEGMSCCRAANPPEKRRSSARTTRGRTHFLVTSTGPLVSGSSQDSTSVSGGWRSCPPPSGTGWCSWTSRAARRGLWPRRWPSWTSWSRRTSRNAW